MIRAWAATALATAIGFLTLDSIWLGLAAGRLYRPRLGPLLLDRFAVAPAAAFYLIYLAGILVFAVAPARGAERSGAGRSAAARGAMLGLVAYATYDLTNQATLRGWSVTVTIADLCWGSFATAMAAAIGCAVAQRVRPDAGDSG